MHYFIISNILHRGSFAAEAIIFSTKYLNHFDTYETFIYDEESVKSTLCILFIDAYIFGVYCLFNKCDE